ncbi:uncharacterized protein LOC122322856 [Drosophila grimshawi]|uniref:uncharacterized protein LOC122322856 n=1 Tax=Drosophila grimshawi TaxID=7222 RepID=UPI001C93295F|nr:uncharacterized protein LOC122322856 [Drosophila grimshawi]
MSEGVFRQSRKVRRSGDFQRDREQEKMRPTTRAQNTKPTEEMESTSLVGMRSRDDVAGTPSSTQQTRSEVELPSELKSAIAVAQAHKTYRASLSQELSAFKETMEASTLSFMREIREVVSSLKVDKVRSDASSQEAR